MELLRGNIIFKRENNKIEAEREYAACKSDQGHGPD
jgi:hypothetical protein